MHACRTRLRAILQRVATQRKMIPERLAEHPILSLGSKSQRKVKTPERPERKDEKDAEGNAFICQPQPKGKSYTRLREQQG